MNTKIEIKDREQEIVFTNFTQEDYEGMWNKKVYRMKAGRSYYLPFYLAEHFAQGLVDREMNKRGVEERTKYPQITDLKQIEVLETKILKNNNLRQELMDKCVKLFEPKELDFIVPKEVPPQETPILKTQERSRELVESGMVAKDALGPYNQPIEEKEKFEGLKQIQEDETPEPPRKETPKRGRPRKS